VSPRSGRQPIGTEPLAVASGLTIQFSGKRIWFCLVPQVEHMTRLLPQAVPYLSLAPRACDYLVARAPWGLRPRLYATAYFAGWICGCSRLFHRLTRVSRNVFIKPHSRLAVSGVTAKMVELKRTSYARE